jgi:hypothetical protein
MNQGIYGEYNVEIVKGETCESYYPFGTGYQKNLILDEFFGKILSGWKHSPQAWMQTCITNTNSTPATRFDTTGTFGTPNDVTWASTNFFTGVNTEENRIFMSRDFIFDTVSQPSKTYREAMVGLFYKDQSNVSAFIESDLAVSHFVFPSSVTVAQGDRLKINYTLNLILDYLSPTGANFQLTGNGYNFDGKIKLMSNNIGIFGALGLQTTYFSNDTFITNAFPYYIYKSISSNSNTYTRDYGIPGITSLYTYSFLGGRKPVYNAVGFYGSSFTPSTFPTKYNGATISGTAATLTSSNFQIDENGASIDVNYYFPPSLSNRNVSGILLNNQSSSTVHNGVVYLAFNSGQTILANDPISMKLRWYFRRL